MLAICGEEANVRADDHLADVFEKDLMKACETGCDEEMAEGVFKIAALFILLKDTGNSS